MKKKIIREPHFINNNNLANFEATSRIVRVLAHEIRNPLTNISLANDQLKDAVGDAGDVGMLLQMIKRNGERINKIISELLQATKFGELNYSLNSIKILIEDVVDSINNQNQTFNININKEYLGYTDTVWVDPDKIKLALKTIVVTALAAGEPNLSSLTISTSISLNKCDVTILITNSTINNEEVQKIFEPFHTKSEKGNGLQLTYANNIFLSHKGSIEVYNTEDFNTVFSISLPLTQPDNT